MARATIWQLYMGKNIPGLWKTSRSEAIRQRFPLARLGFNSLPPALQNVVVDLSELKPSEIRNIMRQLQRLGTTEDQRMIEKLNDQISTYLRKLEPSPSSLPETLTALQEIKAILVFSNKYTLTRDFSRYTATASRIVANFIRNRGQKLTDFYLLAREVAAVKSDFVSIRNSIQRAPIFEAVASQLQKAIDKLPGLDSQLPWQRGQEPVSNSNFYVDLALTGSLPIEVSSLNRFSVREMQMLFGTHRPNVGLNSSPGGTFRSFESIKDALSALAMRTMQQKKVKMQVQFVRQETRPWLVEVITTNSAGQGEVAQLHIGVIDLRAAFKAEGIHPA